jgi:HK97 family phage major capsid protein
MRASCEGGFPVDELIRKLQERRAQLAKDAKEALAKSAESLAANGPKEDRARFDATVDEATAAIKEIDVQVEKLKAQRDSDKRAADLAASTGAIGDQDGAASGEPRATVTSEPQIYGRGSGRSFFLDQARAEIQHDPEAAQRLQRHQQELDVELPRRREARARQANAAVEKLMTRSRREERAYERFLGAGHKVFEGRETRALSRTDGQGGYFVPPLWLVDDYIMFLRAGRVFADQWTNLPLPSGTDSINIPRVVLGTATGPQPADGSPLPGRDMTDNFVNALVRTVAGQQDAAIQLLDQSPVAFDQIIFKDLMADYALNLSGQLIVGSGTNGQLSGLYPAGTLGSSSGPSTTGFVVSDNGAAWTAAAGTNNFYAGIAKLLSQISRNRFAPPTRILTNPAVWYALSSAVDGSLRPLVVPSQQGIGYNEAAGMDGGPVAEGPVGHILGVPWLIDPNIPLTFGGATTKPSIGAISQGNVAPIDGTGSGNTQTPAVAGVFSDLYLWEGELRSRTLSEVLSGTLQVRFQVYGYAADMPNRYQNSAGNVLSYGNYNNGSTSGGALSTAGLLSGF